jgi:hypothetical protein
MKRLATPVQKTVEKRWCLPLCRPTPAIAGRPEGMIRTATAGPVLRAGLTAAAGRQQIEGTLRGDAVTVPQAAGDE